MANIITVCIGSNAPDGYDKVDEALSWLSSLFSTCKSYGPYPTTPYGDASAGRQYFNAVATGNTPLEEKHIYELFKDYETAHGRIHGSHEEVAIDLDLVVLNGNVLRPTDFSAKKKKKGLSHLIDVS